jgi:hypothetical protein
MAMRPVDLLRLVLGVATIAFGMSADKFYPGMIHRRTAEDRSLPKWLGRVWFCVVGFAAISDAIWHWF